jgi:hypothetical protein
MTNFVCLLLLLLLLLLVVVLLLLLLLLLPISRNHPPRPGLQKKRSLLRSG